MYAHILLGKEDKFKLKLFEIMKRLECNQYPVYFFDQYVECSYVKLAKFIHLIDSELTQMDSTIHLLNKQGKVTIKSTLPPIDEYLRFLCKNSTPYRCLVHMLMNPNENLTNFCDREKLSKSTVSRKLRPLIDYLKSIDLRFNKEQLNLQGQESTIRLLFTYFIWNVTRGQQCDDYFKACKEIERKKFFSLGNSERYQQMNEKEINILLGVTILRIKQDHLLHEAILNNLVTPRAQVELNQLSKVVVSEQFLSFEVNFIWYFLLYKEPIHSLSDPRINYIRRYAETCSLIRNQTEQFYAYLKLQNSIGESSEQQKLLWINLFLTFLKAAIAPASLSQYNTTSRVLIEQYYPEIQRTKEKYKGYFIENVFAQKISKRWQYALIEQLAMLSVPYSLEKRKIKKIVVGLIAIYDEWLLTIIKNYLRKFSNVKTVICTKSLIKTTRVDLIISSEASLLSSRKDVRSVLLDSSDFQILETIKRAIEQVDRD